MGNKRERILILLALVSFAVFAGDKLVAAPLLNLWRARATEIAALQQKLDKGQALLDRDAVLRQRWDEMRRRELPPVESTAEDAVLQAVARWSLQSGLGVTSLKPRWVEGEENAILLECTAAAQGALGTIARFLYELERDPLAVRIEEVTITAPDDTGKQLALGMRFSGLVLAQGGGR